MNGIYKMKNAGTSGISYTVHVEIKFIGGDEGSRTPVQEQSHIQTFTVYSVRNKTNLVDRLTLWFEFACRIVGIRAQAALHRIS